MEEVCWWAPLRCLQPKDWAVLGGQPVVKRAAACMGRTALLSEGLQKARGSHTPADSTPPPGRSRSFTHTSPNRGCAGKGLNDSSPEGPGKELLHTRG